MSTPISKPIVVAELTTYDDQRIVFPLAFPQSTWFADKNTQMVRRLESSLQKHVIDRGELLVSVRMAMPLVFAESRLDVEFPATKQRPLLRETFHLFTATLPGGHCHSFVPALGIEVVSESADAVAADVREHVRLEHMRCERLADLRQTLACQWFKEARMLQYTLNLNVLGPDERLKAQSAALLPDVALPMFGAGYTVAGLDAPLAELTQRVEGAFSRSVLIVGTESSGKTSLIHAYAQQRAARGLSPIWETSAVRMLQALTRDTGWQKNLAVLCNELYDEEQVLYVGHLTELFEVGQYEGNTVSIGAALRDALQRGRILLLAECTEAELATLELRSAGFATLFQELRMPKWDAPTQQRIVMDAVSHRGREHGVAIAPDAVEEAILLQCRYSPYAGFPGKPIRFLESLILQQKLRGEGLEREQVMKAFCAETGIPQSLLDARHPLDLQAMRGFFQRRIFGQDVAVDIVCDTLLSIKATMARAGKPIASLMLIGPTGVGKTEMAKALAEYMFGDAERMLRFDMSEYADVTSVLRLTGDLCGGDDGALVTRIRQQPFAVVLFDELEKAHPSFFDLLLQILGEGRLTGGKGQLANFCSAVIVMTSNIGATELQRHPMGLHPEDKGAASVVRHFEQAVQQYFRPELFNRLDHIVPFAPLSDAQRRPIIARELGLLHRREGVRERTLTLELGEPVLNHLCAGVHDDRYGARQMQRVIQDRLVLPLARVLSGIPYARPIAVTVQNDGTQALTIDCAPSNAVARPNSSMDADILAQQRRQLQKILAGPVWIGLVNRRYMLEMQKLKLAAREQRFWELHGKEFNTLNALIDTGEALLADMLAGEGLNLLNPAEQGDQDGFDRATWAQRYLTFKRSVLGFSRPAANRCTVGLYGPQDTIEPLFGVFAEIAKQAGFTQRTQFVRVDRDAYRKIILPLPADAKPDAAPFVGYEFECAGDSAFYLFSGENGVWRWGKEDKSRTDAFVSVSRHSLEKHPTPPNVHRKNFFEGRIVKRLIAQGALSDAKDTWRCPYPSASALFPLLRGQWLQVMDAILTGEDAE